MSDIAPHSAAPSPASGSKLAVVLFNLGAPDEPKAVQPFLFNLFNDKSIIRVPQPFRFMLATLASRRRAPEAGEIYKALGGKSPLLENTRAQGAALEAELNAVRPTKVFVAMRYWHPMSEETALAVLDYDPDEIVLLPLYPQFSTTTTASSLRVWRAAARLVGLDKPTRMLCCYATESGFIEAAAGLVRKAYSAAEAHGKPRVLFSAHGLPEIVVKGGDPYQWQCEQTAAALVDRLGDPELDWVSCYQSRVGPLKWIGPSTEDEIRRAGHDGVPVLVVPMAFVSEHSETLYEIEIEYRHLAESVGVPYFARVPTVGTEPAFIRALARLVGEVAGGTAEIRAHCDGRVCHAGWKGCPNQAAAPQMPTSPQRQAPALKKDRAA